MDLAGKAVLTEIAAKRSGQLRRLYLEMSSHIKSGVLSEILKGLLLLEEFHLESCCDFKEVIEIAGRCCHKLKSLKLINKCYIWPERGSNEDALAIAQHLPGLRHLQLFGPNKLTSDGLLAIYENCPHLESLDVRLNVEDVGPDLVKMLSQQIKDLTLSYDPSVDDDLDLKLMNLLTFLLDEDRVYELSDINSCDETDDLNSLDEDESSELFNTNNVSDD